MGGDTQARGPDSCGPQDGLLLRIVTTIRRAILDVDFRREHQAKYKHSWSAVSAGAGTRRGVPPAPIDRKPAFERERLQIRSGVDRVLSTLPPANTLGSLLEQLFYDSADPIVLEGLDGRIADVNESAVETFGWSREELIGRPYTVLVPRELCAEEAALRRRCIAGSRSRRVRGVRVGKDGKPFDVSLSLVLLRGEQDGPAAIAAIAVPESGAASTIFPANDDPRRVALEGWAEGTPGGVFDVDILNGREYWSPEMLALVGLPPRRPGRFGEEGIPDHIHPDDRERVVAAIRRSHDPDGDGLVETEHRIVLPDGEVRWLLVRGRTLFDVVDGKRRPVRGVGIAFDVTARKEAEEARLKALIDVSSNASWACDAEGRVFEDSPSWRALSGQSEEQLRTSGWLGAVHPDEREAAAAAWRTSIARAAPFDSEWRLLDAADETRHMRIRALPLVNDDDTIRGWVGVGEDITDRKRAELEAERANERAREANALLDAIFAAAPIGLGFWDRDLRFRRINERLAEMHGIAAAEHVGKRLDELLPDIEAPEELYLKWREILATGEPWLGVEVRGETPARPGQLRTWKEDFFPVRVHGEIVGVAAVVQEITERRLAEAQLRESEARFRQMADNAPFMVWVTAPDGGCMFLSRSWYEFTGLPPSAGLGSGWLEPVHPEDRGSLEAGLDRAQERLEPCRSEFRLRRSDGEYRWVLQAAAPRFSPESKFKGYIGSIIDITERKRAEQALEAAYRRKDDFLAMLAHELRNPLAPLTTAAELLRRLPPDGELENLRQMIERQLEHLTRLVDDLLDTSRITTGRIVLRRGIVDLRDVLHHSLETSRPLVASRRHELVAQLPSEPVHVAADPVRLAQIFTNLLNNAAKFTPSGGRISVTADVRGGEVAVTVTDSGVGIARESLPHLFDPLKRADPPRDDAGLGLGLSLVKRLVELHEGTVEAGSDGQGRGATFTVRLPCSSGETPPADAKVSTPRLPRRRILIVDDNDDAASSLSQLLRHAGHEVCDVRDGASALAAARSFAPDVVLLDIGLPDMDGWELARALRAESAIGDAKLIAISGYGQAADRRRSREAGIDRHLTKPVDYASIAACL